MKVSYKFLLTMGAVVGALTACQPSNSSSNVSRAGNGGRTNTVAPNTASSLNGITLNGIIYDQASNQDTFETEVQGFENASVPGSDVGTVSATLQNNTGVFMGGNIIFTSGNLSTMQSSAQIATSSAILIQVIDSYDAQGAPQLHPVELPAISGTVNGTSAVMTFGDSFGTVTLTGNFTTSYFTGTVQYSNTLQYDGSPNPNPGTFPMGQFQVPTCQFFHCQ